MNPSSTPTCDAFLFCLQDHAIHSYWPVLIEGDRKMLRHAIHTDVATGQMNVDYYKANDAGYSAQEGITGKTNIVDLCDPFYTPVY